ncbi:exonuclease domain-containing protein [Thauera sp.]|uniref:3'-5' exonuclease family protein n=1 Tax=Thauera sp. TaxID=1905334 RepID=UPI002C1789FA|nr:exonuclease domain-containing protein [Thauera sp.]HRO37712.1 exonuclease domain-containing protein [Thauera sp.]
MTPSLRSFPGGLAFVDIETTGGPAQRESITEVGIVQVDEDGVREWSTLVRPESRIPDHIQRLTGIDDDMVAYAPRFADIADEVFDRLDGRLFVAHNARFDHGHLRAAFRRAGLDMRPQVLCTVKLSRRLFPDHRRHGLDHLIERHGLVVADRHRALGDAQLLWQFWQKLHERFPPGHIEAMVRELVGHPSLPPHLNPEQIADLPDAPGVYLFYGERGGDPVPAGRSDGADGRVRVAPGAGTTSPSPGRARTDASARGAPPPDLPLYIGKSTRLRSRVLSHFAADHTSDRELSLSQQVRHIEWIETAGEIGALLEEARLVKRLQPTHNRQLRRNRELCTWRLATDIVGDWRLELVHAVDLDFGRRDDLYGFFRTRREATNRLRALARDHALCPPLLGLEKPPQGARCFDFQLKRCRGACHGGESPQAHALRLIEALHALKVEHWTWPGPIGLREGQSIHVVDGWRWLGTATATDEATLADILDTGRPAFDLDIYKILVRAVKRLPVVRL